LTTPLFITQIYIF